MSNQLSREDYHDLKVQIAREQRVIDLSVINPDLAPVQELTDKLLEACLQSNVSSYTLGSGLPQLKNAFARRYQKSFSVDVDSGSVCIGRGTQFSLQSIFFALDDCREESEVLLPLPFYTLHLEAVTKAGYEPRFYELGSSLSETLNNIKQAVQESNKQSSKAKFLIVNFPNNPTGWVADGSFYDDLLAITTGSGITLINDFAYGALEYSQGFACSLLSGGRILEDCLEIFSLSKAYSVPGWRIAGILGNQQLVDRVIGYKNQIDYGPFAPLQLAATHILDSDSDLHMRACEIYSHRAGLVVDALLSLGFDCDRPKAGCAVWASLPSSIDISSYEFCSRFLATKYVGLQPGEIFGLTDSRYIRISLTESDQNIAKVLDLLREFMSELSI